MKFNTKCIHAIGEPDETGAVNPAIHMSSTFSHPGLGKTTGFQYTRESNPTRDRLETLIASLEEGADAVAVSSGMAAIDTVMRLFQPGDHIIIGDDLYGGSIRLFNSLYKTWGLTFTAVGTSDIEAVKAAFQDNTKAVLLETPTNPMMEVTDLAAISTIVHERCALLIVDNTFLSPYFQRPLTLGCDIVIHSGTKFLAGHNDVVCGFVVVKDPDLSERIRFIFKSVGACLSPMDAWLVIRGIKTLPIRMERIASNAQAIAEWFSQQEKVKRVLYPGLPGFAGFEISQKQCDGFGGMISVEVDSEETAKHLLEDTKLVTFAESLGGTETLITYPITQTHAAVLADELARKGINRQLLRISVGIEDVDDLIADFEQALNK